MSAKKVVKTPGSSFKLPRRTGPSPNKSTCVLNSTIATSSNVSTNQPIDWTSECDFAYSEYLRALLTKQLLLERVDQNVESMFDQLSQQIEVLTSIERKKLQLENEVINLERSIECNKLKDKLQEMYEDISNLFCQYDANKNLKVCISSAEENSNKVYLKNVVAFESEVDFNKFVVVLDNCISSLEKLRSLINDTDDRTQILADVIKKFADLQKEVNVKEKALIDEDAKFHYNFFKSLSDAFAKVQGYE